MSDIINIFEKGKIYLENKIENINNLDWNAHQKFKGVYLKHLIKSCDTNDRLSSHLVKVEKNCEIGIHNHDKKLEIHKVLVGNGRLLINNKEIDYYPGVCVLIPDNVDHSVKAIDGDLYLIADFCSALI